MGPLPPFTVKVTLSEVPLEAHCIGASAQGAFSERTEGGGAGGAQRRQRGGGRGRRSAGAEQAACAQTCHQKIKL